MIKNGLRLAGTMAFLYAARRYYRNWGTTKGECELTLPGDELIKQPSSRTTEGITIHAPAESARQTEKMPITSVIGCTSES